MSVKPKLAVVCAHLPSRNTGMVTVDLAAHMVLRAMLPEVDITLYTLGRDDRAVYQPDELPFRYHCLTEHADEFLQADAILYWGDFVHSRSYWLYDMGDWDKAEQAASGGELQAHPKRARYIFLQDHDEAALAKAVIFGSTIITNAAEDEIDADYNTGFQRLIQHCGAVYFRDALSAAKISPLRQHEATLASDCALLLDDTMMQALPGFVPATSRRNIGVFFGRSAGKLPMLFLCRALAKQLGLSWHWLAWFNSSTKLRGMARLLGCAMQQQSENARPGELLQQLSGYELIITDTYHLCVNAWRMGIPAICIGQGAGNQQHSLSDKKKEILYEMYGARSYYVFSESLHSFAGRQREVSRLLKAIQNQGVAKAIAQTIQEHRAMALARLAQAMRKALRLS